MLTGWNGGGLDVGKRGGPATTNSWAQGDQSQGFNGARLYHLQQR